MESRATTAPQVRGRNGHRRLRLPSVKRDATCLLYLHFAHYHHIFDPIILPADLIIFPFNVFLR